jgi:hypothetical protein
MPGTAVGIEVLPMTPGTIPQQRTLPSRSTAQWNAELPAPWPPDVQVPPLAIVTAPSMPLT